MTRIRPNSVPDVPEPQECGYPLLRLLCLQHCPVNRYGNRCMLRTVGLDGYRFLDRPRRQACFGDFQASGRLADVCGPTGAVETRRALALT